MAKSTETLYRILAIERILQNNPYGISVNEIIEKLENEYKITCTRKTIFSNIKMLTRFMPIDKFTGARRSNVYYLKRCK